MAHPAPEHNPFMLMINPEVVLAAMEKSERLGQLNRQLCRPLDRVAPAGNGGNTPAYGEDDSSSDDDTDSAN